MAKGLSLDVYIDLNVGMNRTGIAPGESAIHLFEAMAMARLGEKVIARQLLENINSNNFYFLSRQYMTLLYLIVKQFLRKTAYEQ